MTSFDDNRVNVSVKEYLSRFGEEMPFWLRNYRSGDYVSISDFMKGRVAYYPGCGLDSCLVDVAAAACCVHSFLYVDYYTRRKDIERFLDDGGFRGFRSIGRVILFESNLAPHGQQQLDIEYTLPFNDAMAFVNKEEKPYCFMEILERECFPAADMPPERIAVTFLFADGIMTYYQLFVKEYKKSPWLFLLIDHAFGGNYDSFGGGGLLDKIITKHQRYPDYVLCYLHNSIWSGYEIIKGVDSIRGGIHNDERILYKRRII